MKPYLDTDLWLTMQQLFLGFIVKILAQYRIFFFEKNQSQTE